MSFQRNLAATAGILTLSLLASPLRCRQEGASQKAEATAPKPAPEMDRLKPYLGEWDYVESYEKSAAFPNGGKNTGVYTSKLGPGGNSLMNGFHSQGPVGDFEALIVMTWDPKEKVYKAYLFGNGLPGAVVETGQFEGDALVFRSDFSTGDTAFKLKNVTHFVSPDKIVSEEYFTVPGGPETLMVHVDAKKR